MLNLNSHQRHRIMSSDNAAALSNWWQAFKEKLHIAPPESFDSWEHRPVSLPVYEDDEAVSDEAHHEELDESWLFPEGEIPDPFSLEALYHPSTMYLDDEEF